MVIEGVGSNVWKSVNLFGFKYIASFFWNKNLKGIFCKYEAICPFLQEKFADTTFDFEF
jgi:hypothetical protein